MKKLVILLAIAMTFVSCKTVEVEDRVEYDHGFRVKAYRFLDGNKKNVKSLSDLEVILNAYSWAFRGSKCINPLVETLSDLYLYDSFDIDDAGKGDLLFFIDSNGEPYRVGLLESKVESNFTFLMINAKNKMTYYNESLDLSKVVVKRLRPTIKGQS